MPYEQTYFHMGVHNLDPSLAISFMQEFARFTRKPETYVLGQLLEALEADFSVLVVLNHPLWDMAGVGRAQLTAQLRQFLRAYGRPIHALEINGLRSWQENMSAVSWPGNLGTRWWPEATATDRNPTRSSI